MTLSKLSLRNARRQGRDYLVYFATMVMAAALLYAFNGLVFTPEVRQLSNMLDTLPLTIALASAVVVCIFGWLVSYSTKFMLTRRSREFGTYLLIGLESRQVAHLFLLENLAVGTAALGLGLVLGNLLFQALWAIVLAVFHQPYHFGFSFSLNALGLTLVYFALIYAFAQFNSRKRIRRMKIYDLIYFEKQNEEAALQTSKSRRRIFAISIILGLIGMILMMMNDAKIGIIGAAFLILFLYGFFASFSSGVPAYFEKYATKKYQGQTLLVFRTLSAKLSTMGVVMATISLLITATLLTEGSGLVFHAIFDGRLERNACFDLMVSTGDPETEEFILCRDYVENNWPIGSSWQYPLYLAESSAVLEALEANVEYYRYYDADVLIRQSDYAVLREMLGYDPVSLEPGSYLIHCEPYAAKVLQGWDQLLTTNGQTMVPAGIHTETLAQSLYYMNGHSYFLVVPDAAAGDRTVNFVYAALTSEPVNQVLYDSLCDQLRSAAYQSSATASLGDFDLSMYCRYADELENASMTTVIIFPLYFLAIALTMTAAAILTIQQLSESDRYRRQFTLLRKLGIDRREMGHVLLTQFAIYYTLPALPPVLIAAPFLVHMCGLTEPGTIAGDQPLLIVAVTLALFFLIYAIYILLAYTSLKRSVLPE